MNPFSIPLKDALAVIAENLLPAFSGSNKVLEIVIKMHDGGNGHNYTKVIFWHPNNYMLVAYISNTELKYIKDDEDGDVYTITANHDSTWKYDGLNFFHKLVGGQPKEIEIVSCKIVEIGSRHVINNLHPNGPTFSYRRISAKNVTS